MQRKTLVRVLGLEGRVSELELQQAAEEQAKEGIDEILNDIHEAKEEEVGGTKTKTKPKAKAKPKVKPKAKKTRVTGKRIRKPKIDADKFKRGTSQETVEERLERQAKNREETVAAEEHKKTDEFTETTTGTDPKTGEPLSSEERKRRFKAAKFVNKTGIDSKDLKPEKEAEIGEGEDKKGKIIEFLNADVKDNLDGIGGTVKEIAEAIKAQGDFAEERDDDMRQALLAARKKKREDKLEGKDKKGGGLKEKLLKEATKPVGNFLNKLLKFVTMTFVGMVVNNILSILKNPWKILDPIKQFFNLIISTMNMVMEGMWNITGRPINLIIDGINKGLDSLFGMINNFTKNFGIPAIDIPDIPLTQPFQFPLIPLAGAKKEINKEESTAVGMSGGGVVPGPAGKDGKGGTIGMDGKDGKGGTIGMDGKDAIAVGKDGVEGKKGDEGLRGKDGSVGMAGGGLVPGYEGGGGPGFENITNTETTTPTENSSDPFSFGKKYVSPEEAKERLAAGGMPSMELSDGSVVPNFGKMGADEMMKGVQMVREGMVNNPEKIQELDNFMATNPYAQPDELQRVINAVVPGSQAQVMDEMGADISASAKMNGGGVVPTPYPVGDSILGLSGSYSGLPGYNNGGKVIKRFNKGGKVPGQGEGDTVPAMLTPGEFVMSKGAVNMIGADKLMAMNAAGGGTNQPTLMKFAGGGIVPGDIPPPKGRGGKVIMMGGGGSKSSRGGGGSGEFGEATPTFSSVDQNNPNITVIKSIYNIMS